ncbi:hypothetical protein BU16DRAFT_539005 [Lophium mytilinum]|uniref:MYND-type domain-containing protein n=1 Tax=Lophium mytilinum TaxID=390894 RepID=A0A6A6QWJ3_9PEZI|nr:hypothetical protein BU16DRAFT_539005 [Lophium mytilinum]
MHRTTNAAFRAAELQRQANELGKPVTDTVSPANWSRNNGKYKFIEEGSEVKAINYKGLADSMDFIVESIMKKARGENVADRWKPTTYFPERPRHQDGCSQCGSAGCLSVCGNCAWIQHCSKVCQRAGWKKHKPLCERSEESKAGTRQISPGEKVEEDFGVREGSHSISPERLRSIFTSPQLDTMPPKLDLKDPLSIFTAMEAYNNPEEWEKLLKGQTMEDCMDFAELMLNRCDPNQGSFFYNDHAQNSEFRAALLQRVSNIHGKQVTDLVVPALWGENEGRFSFINDGQRMLVVALGTKSLDELDFSQAPNEWKPTSYYPSGPAYKASCQACMATEGLRLCSGCKWASYCSKECQRGAWPVHKLICKRTADFIPGWRAKLHDKKPEGSKKPEEEGKTTEGDKKAGEGEKPERAEQPEEGGEQAFGA